MRDLLDRLERAFLGSLENVIGVLVLVLLVIAVALAANFVVRALQIMF
jgi:hypothetical protein